MSTEFDRNLDAEWHVLALDMRGTLLQRGDDGYDSARRVWNGAINRFPPAIARCADAGDVITAVKFARRKRMAMTVRGGGHNVAGLAVRDDALMLDLGAMNGVEVDPRSNIVRVEGGALWRDVDAATGPFGLATTGGLVSTTGVGGYTLGGGAGWLMRRCGLAADNVLEANVVLADGRSIVASKQSCPDIFWALRGGGAGLGVVTRFTYRLHAVADVLAGVAFHPLDAAPGLLRAFADFVPHAEDPCTAMLVLTTAPSVPFLPERVHGERVIALAYCWSGPLREGERTLQPLADYGNPLGRHHGMVPYVDWQQNFDGAAPAGDQYYWTSAQFDAIDDALIRKIVDGVASAPDPMCELHIQHLGGAVARVANTATAFTHRDVPFFVNVIGRTDVAQRYPAVRDWVRGLGAGFGPHARTAIQTNFAGEDGGRGIRTHDAAAQARLAGLRARYDPDGLLLPRREP